MTGRAMFNRMVPACVLIVAVTVCAIARASDLPPLARLHDGHPVDVSGLPDQPHVIVVWMQGCAPCLEELRHLKEIAARTPGWGYVTLALDEPARAREALPHEAAFATAWIASGKPADVLALLNPEKPALPLALGLDRKGEVCARRVGLLGSDVVNGWAATCSK